VPRRGGGVDFRPCQGEEPRRGGGVDFLPCQGEEPRRGEGVETANPEILSQKLNNLPHLKTFRKTLRKNLTPAEAKLWTMLQGKQLAGRKFRRQHSVANYILDFYCPAEKVAIELDGQVHNSEQAAEYDRERDVFLAHTGIKVLRFENKVVFQNPEGLLAEVQSWFGRDKSLDPSGPAGHLPLTGEE
jgi:very-short-patch-repair endonuclease